MKRREVLAWLSRGMSSAMTLIIGLPGFRFLSQGHVSSAAPASDFQRMKRLQDLPPGRPVMVPVLGSKKDAWVQGDQQVVGRVWIVRQNASTEQSTLDEPQVRVFNSVCPHMGCQIQTSGSCPGFVCPCHRATFGLNGQRQRDATSLERNHAPRDMDELPCRIVQDQSTSDAWVEVKFESFELGSERRTSRS